VNLLLERSLVEIAGSFLFVAAVLFIDYRQIKELRNERKNEIVGPDWETEYREASDDRRQYTNLTWQLPSAILVADGLAISFAYSKDFRAGAPWWGSGLLLLAAFVFNSIMFVNFWKFAYRSYSRFLRLKRIESRKKLRRMGERKERIPIRWGTWRWMALMIIFLTTIMFELAISALGV
jgi:hypothetical protein